MKSLLASGIQQLNAAPRFSLGHFPTRLEPLDRLSEALNGPRIWVKREDCSGLATGGNKTRKLEFLVGEAIQLGADILISAGALQSNHARQVAAAAAKAGLRAHLILTDSVPHQDDSYSRVGNAQLCRLLGAQITLVDGSCPSQPVCESLAQRLTAEGAHPYLIPIGGSNGIGTLGYVDAFLEIERQCEIAGITPDAIYLASGSGGTQAGLLLGAYLSQRYLKIKGISVGAPSDIASHRIRQAMASASTRLGLRTVETDIHVDAGYTGPGYGLPDTRTYEALALAARLEGLVLDPVYSGKGMAGLIGHIRTGQLSHARNVVFIHTGGVAALSAYPD